MSKRIHALAQRLLGKNTIDDCELEEIRSLARRYPYFAPAQFLLLEKLKQEGSDEYPIQCQKSVLYYHNPLEFQYFISSDRFYTEVADEEALQHVAFPPTPAYQDRELATGNGMAAQALEITTEEAADTDVFAPNKQKTALPEELTAIEGTPPSPAASPSETGWNARPPDPVSPSDEQGKEVQEEREPEEGVSPAPLSHPETVPLPGEAEKESASLPPLAFQQPADPNQETALAFEPYHTVDYFPSQGIRLSQEDIPKDKFGKQLKSFTEWLKTMKRLPATQMAKSVDAGSESKVQHLAEDSIHESDVWTEAMAEVWIKQGNREKAIETYNKLSLLNPSKKVYFASKIENLKRP